MTRALLFQSDLPTSFWGEALLHSTYLINRLPTKLLAWKTPFEVLFNKPPEYDHLRTFGCLAFATNIFPHKDKLAPRAQACIFLGFHNGTKGFKLYDINTQKIIMSRNVKFHETIFPYIDSNFENDHACPSLPLTPDLQDDPLYKEGTTTQVTTPS